MLNLNPTSATALLPAPAAPASPAPAAPQGSPAPAGAQSFASLLQRSQASAPAAAPAGPEQKAAEPAPHADRSADDSTQADAADGAAPGSRADDDEHTVTADPALADWLAGLNLPAPNPAVPPAPGADPALPTSADARTPTGEASAADLSQAGSAAAVAAQAAAAATAAGPATTGASATLAAAPARGSGERGADASARGSASDAANTRDTPHPALAAATDRRGGEPGSSPQGEPGADGQRPAWTPVASVGLDSITAVPMPAALQAAAPQPGQSAALPVAVDLPTPLHAPEFPQALGVQLSVLAQDGVEHAELHLNPAQMGPVSVQIVMDGTHARIDFGADTAATRQAIEASLPELAGALRDAGLTLTGGGVSQHARHRQEAAEARHAAANPSRGDGDAATDDSKPSMRTVRLGGIDAYA